MKSVLDQALLVQVLFALLVSRFVESEAKVWPVKCEHPQSRLIGWGSIMVHQRQAPTSLWRSLDSGTRSRRRQGFINGALDAKSSYDKSVCPTTLG